VRDKAQIFEELGRARRELLLQRGGRWSELAFCIIALIAAAVTVRTILRP